MAAPVGALCVLVRALGAARERPRAGGLAAQRLPQVHSAIGTLDVVENKLEQLGGPGVYAELDDKLTRLDASTAQRAPAAAARSDALALGAAWVSRAEKYQNRTD